MEGRRCFSQSDLGTPDFIARTASGREWPGGPPADYKSMVDLLDANFPHDTGKDSQDENEVTGMAVLDYDSDASCDATNKQSIPIPAATCLGTVAKNNLPSRDGRIVASTSQSVDCEPMSVDSCTSRHCLDPVYYQCRATRTSGFRDILVSVSPDESFGKKIISQSPAIGSFESHAGIEDTFNGSRILKGNTPVNQSMSCSFDPSKLVCISCSTEHVITCNGPMVVLFTDQNFVPSLPSSDNRCINIVRVENPSLDELLEIAI